MTEVGAMNIFFVIEKEGGGGLELITSSLDAGDILEGDGLHEKGSGATGQTAQRSRPMYDVHAWTVLSKTRGGDCRSTSSFLTRALSGRLTTVFLGVRVNKYLEVDDNSRICRCPLI